MTTRAQIPQTSTRMVHPQAMPSERERKIDSVVSCVEEWVNGAVSGRPRSQRLAAASRIIRRNEEIREEHISAAIRQLRARDIITLAEADRI